VYVALKQISTYSLIHYYDVLQLTITDNREIFWIPTGIYS